LRPSGYEIPRRDPLERLARLIFCLKITAAVGVILIKDDGSWPRLM